MRKSLVVPCLLLWAAGCASSAMPSIVTPKYVAPAVCGDLAIFSCLYEDYVWDVRLPQMCNEAAVVVRGRLVEDSRTSVRGQAAVLSGTIEVVRFLKGQDERELLPVEFRFQSNAQPRRSEKDLIWFLRREEGVTTYVVRNWCWGVDSERWIEKTIFGVVKSERFPGLLRPANARGPLVLSIDTKEAVYEERRGPLLRCQIENISDSHTFVLLTLLDGSLAQSRYPHFIITAKRFNEGAPASESLGGGSPVLLPAGCGVDVWHARLRPADFFVLRPGEVLRTYVPVAAGPTLRPGRYRAQLKYVSRGDFTIHGTQLPKIEPGCEPLMDALWEGELLSNWTEVTILPRGSVEKLVDEEGVSFEYYRDLKRFATLKDVHLRRKILERLLKREPLPWEMTYAVLASDQPELLSEKSLLLADNRVLSDSRARGLVAPFLPELAKIGHVGTLRALMETHDPRFYDVFLQMTEHESSRVRRSGFVALGYYPGELSIEKLMETALQGPAASNFGEVVHSLGRLRVVRAAEPLMELVKQGKLSDHLLSHVIPALAEINADGTEEFLLDVLGQSGRGNGTLSALIVRALGKAGTEKSVPVLLEFLHAELDTRLGADAVHTLAHIGGKEALGGVVVALHQAAHPDVRAEAARALGATRDRTYLPDLKKALNDGRNQEIRGVIATATKALEPAEP